MKSWLYVTLFLFGLITVTSVVSYCNRAVTVVANEVDPAILLKKYEWFKNAAAELNKKKADISIYESKLKKYEKVDITKMDRITREQMMTWEQEVAGVKASYNSLAAEYNAQMAKINWQFTNVGDLPKGATDPLPREFAEYKYQ